MGVDCGGCAATCPARAGELDDRDHVVLIDRKCDERPLLPEREIEGLRCDVPAVPARLDHDSVDPAT
jgi:hypothetical protein